MRTFFSNNRLIGPKVSVVLVDWSCRESFHIFDYLEKQTVPRRDYEVVWIEYYDRKAEPIEQKLILSERSGKDPVVDQWLALEMPRDVYFHKHLMYNAGIVLSRGEIVVICDSDAMVRETFVESIIAAFERDRETVLHLDEFRNERKDLYPFSYPSFETVLGHGSLNHCNGKTSGLLDHDDPIHARNYGACMAALRQDLINIGGSDEHIDYLGHICGPYDMTFRLVNLGRKELWHPSEFLYHVWHPGQAGRNDYLGPHDGKHVSTTALGARWTGRVFPYVENPAIRNLRSRGGPIAAEQLLTQILSEENVEKWSIEKVARLKPRLWRTLISSHRPVTALRLIKTLFKLLMKRVRKKAMQASGKAVNVSKNSGQINETTQPGLARRTLLNIEKAYNFLTRTMEFCAAMTNRSRECLESLVAQEHHEVSLYGTDDVAEILYDLTFDTSVKVKNIYDDFEGKSFHGFKVLTIEKYVAAKEKLIVTGVIGAEKKIERLKTLGISLDKIMVLQ